MDKKITIISILGAVLIIVATAVTTSYQFNQCQDGVLCMYVDELLTEAEKNAIQQNPTMISYEENLYPRQTVMKFNMTQLLGEPPDMDAYSAIHDYGKVLETITVVNRGRTLVRPDGKSAPLCWRDEADGMIHAEYIYNKTRVMDWGDTLGRCPS